MQVAELSYPDLKVPLSYGYTYDAVGNITKITDPLQGTRTYTYDDLGQLTKEVIGGNTYTFTYDSRGNLKTAVNGTGSHTYSYGSSVYGDRLTRFDGNGITYDSIGNPLVYHNDWEFTWINGRQLKNVDTGTKSAVYEYSQTDGMRVKKTVSGTTYRYYYEGGKLMRMTIGDDTEMDFFYDFEGKPYAVKHNDKIYYYVLNLQGDVVRLVSSTGTSYGSYKYDAWGNILYESSGAVMKDNPLRYRGYVYDAETAFYYLASRYVHPKK